MKWKFWNRKKIVVASTKDRYTPFDTITVTLKGTESMKMPMCIGSTVYVQDLQRNFANLLKAMVEKGQIKEIDDESYALVRGDIRPMLSKLRRAPSVEVQS